MFGRPEIHVCRFPSRPQRLEDRLDAVHPKVLHALREGHAALDRLGVPHCLVGGLAVGLYGRARATRDVEFLVGSEAFDSQGAILSFRPGMPLAIHGVPVDSIPIPDDQREVLEAALHAPCMVDGIPVVPVETLVFMKLSAGRRQDLADVTVLLDRADLDLAQVRDLLQQYAPDLIPRFEALLDEVQTG